MTRPEGPQLGGTARGAFAPTGPGPRLRGRLCRQPPSLCLDPPTTLAVHDATRIRTWFSDGFLAPLNPDPDHRELTTWLAELRFGPGPLTISAMYRERCGGRRYSFHIPSHTGDRIWSARAFHAAFRRTHRLLLPAIPRRLRAGFRPAAGHRYLTVDVDRCFPTLLATVARDEVLLADLCHGDLHQRAGDAMAGHLHPEQRRELGKLFNNAVVGLISEQGWYRALRSRGLQLSRAEAGAMHARWWGRYPRARALRDAWSALHRDAARRAVPLTLTYPDGRVYRFDVASLRGHGRATRPVSDHERLEIAVRRSFSAIWRGVEGVLLDDALHRLYELRDHGLRLVLPLYDGLLLQIPAGSEEVLAAAVRHAVDSAAAALGVPATTTVHVGPRWGSHAMPTVVS